MEGQPMAFMERQITGKIQWVEMDGNDGITFIPAADVPEILEALAIEDDEDRENALEEACGDYYSGTRLDAASVTTREGYGARLIAPGYMDRTEWTVYDTEQEAEDGLTEMYGDEDEDEDAD